MSSMVVGSSVGSSGMDFNRAELKKAVQSVDPIAIKRLAASGSKFDTVDRLTGTTPIMDIVKQISRSKLEQELEIIETMMK